MTTPIDSIAFPVAIDTAGRLAEETDYAAHVEQLMEQLLLTAPGERINQPEFGCGVARMLFAPNSDVSAQLMQVTIQNALDTWLGTLITTQQIDVQASDEVLQVRVVYILKARNERRYLDLDVTL